MPASRPDRDPISAAKPERPEATSARGRHEQAKDYGTRVTAAEHAVDQASQALARSNNRGQPGGR